MWEKDNICGGCSNFMRFRRIIFTAEKRASTKGQGDKIYRSLSKDDRQVADVYATLYETDKEEVARIQKKTNDWEKTNKQLEKEFLQSMKI